ncbi:HEPN domain-containing protein [bacterium]|nr:HEPN domain-containing protein [bacterium]
MHPEKSAEVKAWLQKAQNDLRAGEIDLEASPPLIEDALFHSQQAVEKTMKGFLTAHDKIFRKTHDLDELGLACENIDESLMVILDPARELTVFAWAFRYPGDMGELSVDEARETIEIARNVYNEVINRLPDEVRP